MRRLRQEAVSELDQLAREIEAYEANRERLLRDARGKFVLIHDDQIAGTYDTEGDAIDAGYRRFGNVPFFVRQVSSEDRPATFDSPFVVA